MSLWDNANQIVTTTALVFSPPLIAGAIVQRLNEIDRINSQFALQDNQQEFQASMQGNQQAFQARMQGNQQEFQANVEKLRTAAQFTLQAKGQAFQAELEAVKIDTQFGLQDRGHEFQAALEGVRQRFNREMEEYRQFCENARLQKRQDFEQEQLTRRLQHEQSLEAYRRETQLILSRVQLLMALELADDKEVRESFPLKTPARVILNAYKNYQNNLSPIPLLVVISPPALEFEKFPNAAQGFSRIEARLTDEVQEFCKHYPLTSEARPVRYQGADWETKSAHGKSAVDVLHHVLKSVPTVVLESKVDGDLLRIYLAGWDVLEKTPHYEKVLTVPWKEVLYPIARKYAQKWREYRMTLLDKNKTLEEIQRRGGDDELNLLILEEEEEDREFGFGGKEDYKYNVKEEKYIQELSQFLGICHCILVGLMADRYHFTHGDTPPKLPELLPGLLEKVPSQSLKEMLVAEIVTSYQSLYQLTGVERPNAIPYLFLDLALSLSGLPDKSWAKNQVEYSLLCWLSLRNLSNGVVAEKSGLRELLTVFTSALMDADAEYLQKLIACLSRFEGDYQQMMQEAMQQHAIELKRQQEAERKRREEEKRKRKLGSIFTFDVVKVNPQGKEISRSQGQAQQIITDLGNGVTLEMVLIPGGTFTMGSPAGEGSSDEKPQHQVTIKPFLMGKYPVTQAQWRQVASFPKLQRDLDPNPSRFKGENLPIEQVSWYDAVEWCARLSKKIGKPYRLPSEAEWEYAARAGTTTAFHIGETLTTELANYGSNQGKTTPVGYFKHANAFGLYDIHGNVWEWCADPWHDSYSGAPSDGRVWDDNDFYYKNYVEYLVNLLSTQNQRVLRGGSWNGGPDDCRCAARLRSGAGYRYGNGGFRVSCLPPETL